MRRNEREVTNKEDIISIIGKCRVLHLAMVDDGKPYVETLNYGHIIKDHKLYLYFQCTNTGRVISIIKKNPQVAFEISYMKDLAKEDIPSSLATDYSSISGFGIAEILEDEKDISEGLESIIHHYGFSQKALSTDSKCRRSTIIKINVEEFTAKSNCNN